MRKIIHLQLLLILFLLISKTLSAQSEFELVESVPVETTLEVSSLPRTLDVWLKMISDAKTSIDIETFYFANKAGELLERILAAIKEAAGRGVKVRIIVDSNFYSNNEKSVDELDHIFNILIRKIPVGNISGGVMHAKYFIVDNENLFLGSQNMDWRALIHIHEVGVRVKDNKLASTFKELFETDWLLCEGNYSRINSPDNEVLTNSLNSIEINSDKFGKIVLYPAFSPVKINKPGFSYEEDELMKVIGNAGERLYIQLYSYSPRIKKENGYYKIDSALREAAGRGVEVKIIFPNWAIRESSMDFIKDLSLVSNVQIRIVSIPEHSSGFIPYSRVDHSKYFIADKNISWISTANWEWSYFNNSRNATLIIDNVSVNDELSKIFDRVWNSPYSEPIDINKKYEPVKRN